ncbi:MULTISPECIES: hypothetical protein [Bacteria]|uniref:hypothetical protein n=1 Tax=Bacteria TaxID=2 RepID=UPI003C7A2B45
MENAERGTDGRDDRRPGVPRRTLVKGAAWTVPVIAATVVVPATSASVVPAPCVPGGASVQAVDGWAGAGIRRQTVTIPAGATNIRFTVRGGDGWYSLGALVTGMLTPTGSAPLEVEIIAGQHGVSGGPHLPYPLEAYRTYGYGRGGVAVPDHLTYQSAGAGSAIARTDTGEPLVVAGGAGSSSNGFGGAQIGTGNGNAGLTAESGHGQYSVHGQLWAGASGGAVGALPGLGGQGGVTAGRESEVAGVIVDPGGSGTAPSVDGGHGGDGGFAAWTDGVGWGGGAGGGGYAGGGGGGVVIATHNGHRDGTAAFGGAGSSYVSTGGEVLSSRIVTATPPANESLVHGMVQVFWDCV